MPTPPPPRPPIVEFQAVILAGEDECDLSPLIDRNLAEPQCVSLLPICNRPLLYFQLKLLQVAGFTEVILALEEVHRKQVQEYLHKERLGIRVELFHPTFQRNKKWTSCAVLAQLGDRIFTDFIVLSGDVVTEVSIHALADVHRTRDAAVTLCLKENPDEDVRGTMFSWIAAQQRETEVVYGLQESGPHMSDARLVLATEKRPDGACMVGRQLLDHFANFSLRSNLTDSHVYIFKRWVLDFLQTGKELGSDASVKEDLIPFLALQQSRQKDFQEKFPDIWAKAKSKQALAHAMSASAWNAPKGDDRIRVYAHVSSYVKQGTFCARATTVEAFSWISMSLLEHGINATTPWEPFVSHAPSAPEETSGSSVGSAANETGSVKSSGTAAAATWAADKSKLEKVLIGANCVIHPSAKLSKCIIGDNCYIGANTRVSKCILFPGCRIGDGSQLEDCMFSYGVVVGKKCNLGRFQVGPKCEFKDGHKSTNKREIETIYFGEEIED